MSRSQARQLSGETFAERLLEARTLAVRTQESIARELDVSTRTYQRWERGGSEPPSRLLVQLAALLGFEADDFYPAAVSA